MKKLYLHVAVAALMVLPAGSALAAGEMDGLKGLYGGASFGRAEAEDACEQVSKAVNDYVGSIPEGISLTGSCDDNDNGWKIFAGYQFTPNWGIEGAYVDLGEFTANYTLQGDALVDSVPVSVFGTAHGKATVDGFSLALTGTAPYSDNFAVFAKVGAYFWDVDESGEGAVHGTIGDLGFSDAAGGSRGDDGTSLLLGIGAKFNFTPNVGMRAEWEWYQDVGKRETTGKTDINLLSLGLLATF